jgi:DNA polymerase-3 subunit delta
MAPLTREDLRNQLKRREIAPVYVLFGPETQLRDLAAETIADFCFAEGEVRDFNETTFSLNNEDNLRQALAAAWQLPMMASRRVIRITDVRLSATGYRDTIIEADEGVLTSYFAEPSPTSVVIFVADELNGVRKMGRLLRDKTTAVEFVSLNDREFAEWARKQIRDAGLEVDDVSLRQLFSRIGPDVRRLSNEINKLAAAALPSKVITPELIDALVPNSRELSNFDLTDHLVAGRKQQALTALRKMLDDGAEPLMLLGLIGANYRQLLAVKDLMSRGADRRDVTRAIKAPPRNHESILAAARRTDLKKLSSAIQGVAKADLAIKTSLGGGGPKAARMQIEMLVCELALMDITQIAARPDAMLK